VTPGQQHEATEAQALLEHAQGNACIADTGYDSAAIRAKAKARKMKAVIPSHPTRTKQRRPNKQLYRLRYMVECFFHRLKRFRAVATRYEKSATNFLAVVHIACMTMWI
jgi:transposase